MRYKLKENICNCHPETCCCDDYAIIDTRKGVVYLTMNSRGIGRDICKIKNDTERSQDSKG